MAKSRKTKAKRSDFQKVKLKVGKRLPKGLNETVATFKSKSIKIKEQLKNNDGDQPSTKRRLNLKDLLTQSVHYSPKVRHEAVSGIRELFGSNKSLVAENLSVLFERTSALLVDKDVAVRSGFIRLLKLIFTTVSSAQISPYEGLLGAQLCMAMTHLAEEIQQDSLSALDVCLDHAPNLALSQRVLTSFLQLISRPSGSTGRRSLNSNPASKLSGAKWRKSVLQRLHRILSALFESHQQSGKSNLIKPITVHWKDAQGVGIVVPNTASVAQRCTWSLRGVNDASSEQLELISWIGQLQPLLIECQAGKDAENLPEKCMQKIEKILLVLNKD